VYRERERERERERGKRTVTRTATHTIKAPKKETDTKYRMHLRLCVGNNYCPTLQKRKSANPFFASKNAQSLPWYRNCSLPAFLVVILGFRTIIRCMEEARIMLIRLYTHYTILNQGFSGGHKRFFKFLFLFLLGLLFAIACLLCFALLCVVVCDLLGSPPLTSTCVSTNFPC